MTHPALFSVSDAIEAIDVALAGSGLSIIHRQVLMDLRDDLHMMTDFDTFEQICHAADEYAKRGF